MSYYPASVMNLIKQISKLPGIGGKTAERLAMHILRAPRREAEQLSQSIIEIKEKVRHCSMCFALSDTVICNICSKVYRCIICKGIIFWGNISYVWRSVIYKD